ncbi:TetR/AcrR family transcriptional regulator [Chelativorans salis]|uniref:TetR/AcrR family transcriptional regulator n=1 Tax=Chelativorans salis TaxID=2978478 RepID=A0ABT2LT22_9HYPH|nr:TetR/AcrR family transcriptional regulator [Chelativorans sp. EGI FJ00035]MCT7377685.1 TetR/AcrR family transcriptional regulator [Chelativorans sp. EGI FJ00035]
MTSETTTARIDRRTSNSRDEILDAAQRIVQRDGAGRLTIDGVAREAGLSKGGVLYNFPNKESLLKGMLDRMMQNTMPMLDAFREEFAGGPNPTLRAIIKTSANKECLDPALSRAILAVAAEDPEMLAPLRAELARRWEQVQQECEDRDMAALLWAAADGLMFHALMDIGVFPPEKRAELLEKLDNLATTTCK